MRTATTVVAEARPVWRGEPAPRGDSHRGRRGETDRCGGRRSGLAGPGSSRGRGVLGGRIRSGVLGRVGLVPSPSVTLRFPVTTLSGDDIADEREDAVEMSKAHARQGSPALNHGLAPARAVGGDARGPG